MAYLDIVFHNVRQGGQGCIDGANSRANYTVNFPNLANVYQTPVPGAGYAPGTTAGAGAAPASAAWGNNITAGGGAVGGASGIFFCESSPYPYLPDTHYHIGAWTGINQITSPPRWNKGDIGWNPPAGWGSVPVPGWTVLPGYNCPFGTAPGWPGFPVGATDWIPPLAWALPPGAAPGFLTFDLPTWASGLPAAAVFPAPPAFSSVPDLANIGTFTPAAGLNYVCAFLEGLPDLAPPVMPAGVAIHFPGANWLGARNPASALQCVGTGDAAIYNNAPPPGSDRYAIFFQARQRTYNTLTDAAGNPRPISGLFVHTKAEGDPGTQLVVLCNRFTDSIIFGDLNYDIKRVVGGALLHRQSLQEAIGATHRILAIEQVGGSSYSTHRTPAGAWNTCLDYALVPNDFVNHVELWGYRYGAAAVLAHNASDHSMMMLRIHCN